MSTLESNTKSFSVQMDKLSQVQREKSSPKASILIWILLLFITTKTSAHIIQVYLKQVNYLKRFSQQILECKLIADNLLTKGLTLSTTTMILNSDAIMSEFFNGLTPANQEDKQIAAIEGDDFAESGNTIYHKFLSI